MITQISITPQCVSYPGNPSLIGAIGDFGIFPEISSRYLDLFDSAKLLSSRNDTDLALLRVNPERKRVLAFIVEGLTTGGLMINH